MSESVQTGVMGIVDLVAGSSAAIEQGLLFVAEGATFLEISGAHDQLDHVLVAVADLAKEATIWIKTEDEAVARACLEAGATMLSGTGNDLFGLAAEFDIVVVAAHGGSTRATDDPAFAEEMCSALSQAIAAGLAAGARKVMIDLGVGPLRTAEQNLQLMGSVDRFVSLGAPLVVGTDLGSRAHGTLEDSIVVATVAAMNGVDIVRTRHVRAVAQAIQVVGPHRERPPRSTALPE